MDKNMYIISKRENDMKNVFIFLIFVFLIGCSNTSKIRREEPPRREFTSVENIDVSSTEPFIVNEFISDGTLYQMGSIYFSTALLLSEIGILETIGNEVFKIYSTVFFSELPTDEHFKQIVIPNLSKSSEIDIEKNAYFFITKQKTQEGNDCYLIESNIPIASISGGRGRYNGYEMRLNKGFYKDRIPARWTSIMFLYINGNNLLYSGMAYPAKSDIFAVRGSTGNIGTERMATLFSGRSSVSEMKNNLEIEFEITLAYVRENNFLINEIEFFEKYTYLSLSAYSFIDNNFEDAVEYYISSNEINVIIPDDAMGRSFSGLKVIMDYLINIINE